MSAPPFRHHREAAVALLSGCAANLTRKAAGMLGHYCWDRKLSPAQRDCLDKLLDRNGLPPLAD
jgi:hypothetical protein